MFCKLYTRLFWRVYGNIAKWPSPNLYLRLPRKPNGNVAMQLFCNLYSSLRWQVHGNLLRCRVLHLLVAKEDFCVLYARLIGEHFAILPGYLFAMFMQDSQKNHKAILPCKCLASFMQGDFGEGMATPKSSLLAIFIKGAPKTKWQCYHATFLQSLRKFALACTGNLFRYQGLFLLVDRKGFCVLYARSFAKLFLGQYCQVSVL